MLGAGTVVRSSECQSGRCRRARLWWASLDGCGGCGWLEWVGAVGSWRFWFIDSAPITGLGFERFVNPRNHCDRVLSIDLTYAWRADEGRVWIKTVFPDVALKSSGQKLFGILPLRCFVGCSAYSCGQFQDGRRLHHWPLCLVLY